MPHYMHQSLFNTLAYTVAWAHEMSGGDASKAEPHITELMRSYIRFYKTDKFETELFDAAQHTSEWMLKTFPQMEDRIQVVTSLMVASKNYQPDGRKTRRRWFFNGLRFTSSKQPVPDRVSNFIKDTMRYHLGLTTGLIPAASVVVKDGHHTIVE